MEKQSREELVSMYRPDVEKMCMFLPWLENKKGNDVTSSYNGTDAHKTMVIPVYDSIMLEFLNELGSTIFMNQNYRYIYARYRMKDLHDELNMIKKADIMTMDILCGILSKYTLGGLTKAYLWTQGMENQIFWKAIERAKQIIEFYDVPIIIPTYEEEESAEEPIEELVEDTVEEPVEEPIEELVEDTVEEPAEEPMEETVEESMEEAESVAEEVNTEETVTEDAVTEDAVTEEVVTQEAVTEDAVAEEVETQEAITEDVVTEETVTEATSEAEMTIEEIAIEETTIEDETVEETSQEEITDLGLEDVLESLDNIEAEIETKTKDSVEE